MISMNRYQKESAFHPILSEWNSSFQDQAIPEGNTSFWLM